ncbi:MAG: carbamate kinase [candidate division Zixibacteria bacterium]|nr:carbamate kinase [candidate division Zixibacteria bacterium]
MNCNEDRPIRQTAANRTAVVALGGNAITRPDQEDTIANQFANTRKSLDGIVDLARDGFNLVISHGNGPQVGNALLRVELARGRAPILPLGVLVADTEGGMGYMIEQSLQNRLRSEKIDRRVVTLITQMLIDMNDPALQNPTKFIGQFYTEEEARRFAKERGWTMKQDAQRGWRRVVPSPKPTAVVNGETIRELVARGIIVIAAGGGGIPVYLDGRGYYEGFDAVIDKDLASAVLANEIGADILCILTAVDHVAVAFGTPQEKKLEEVTVTRMRQYLREGHFPPGSMGPKVEAAVKFIEHGGKLVIITSLENAHAAVHGQAGTRIRPD